ncbi:lipopolysaccharide heptosyltransferase I [Neisseria leonii]|uniref:lipopolysaccharide heptosyltransferase I n=1 Tax=Neisseria leonii TaxID=2995413 RepID=UPI00237C08E1|nr:lipopolysaccharide heptosyltransferase I [Neisseria sp. 3986]MDD9326487.1 lipopolysaccharide heptosyltransferase I [Neisseria sp. 3986]
MKVLLVRLSSMGDLIHTLPAVTDLAQAEPDIELHWLCEESFADIARLHPFVRNVHTLRWRAWRKNLGSMETWRALWHLKETLMRERYDFVLDSQGLFKSALFAKLANAPLMGLDRQSARESWVSAAYNRTFFVRKGQDAVLRNRLLFAQVFDYALPPRLAFGAEVPPVVENPARHRPYYVALHASSRDSKLWRQDYWRELLVRLNARDGAAVYLPWGSEGERQRAEAIAHGLPFAHLCPRLSLMEAAALLQSARGVAGVDTGLLHLANALNVPLVGIYTDTDPQKTGVQQSVLAGNVGGVGQMPEPEAVYRALLRHMAAADVVEAV